MACLLFTNSDIDFTAENVDTLVDIDKALRLDILAIFVGNNKAKNTVNKKKSDPQTSNTWCDIMDERRKIEITRNKSESIDYHILT